MALGTRSGLGFLSPPKDFLLKIAVRAVNLSRACA